MMRIANVLRIAVVAGLFCLHQILPGSAVRAEDKAVLAQVGQPIALQNDQLGLVFDGKTGALTAIENRLAGETYQVQGDQFEVEAVQFHTGFADAKFVSLAVEGKTLTADYQSNGLTIQVLYTLRGHFVEKQMTLTSPRDYGLKKLILSQPTFSADTLDIVCYRYPQFGRSPGGEPLCTYFGRTAKGGFFTGVEVPFAASSLSDRQITLAYAPSLKVKAGEKLVCEPVYFGVYRRRPADDLPPAHPPIRGEDVNPKGAAIKASPVASEVLPLPSESEAMVAMTSAILGPPRHGLVPMVCGWGSEMVNGGAYTEQSVAGDMRSLDFVAECGIDLLTESQPWGGQTAKMNALGADDKYAPGELVAKFLEHAREKGVKVVMWPSMNNTHPWSWWGEGRPFRADKPEWLMTPKTLDGKPDLIKGAKANCSANTPFFNWLSRINEDGLGTGYYKGWCMDGSFFGDGGWFSTVIPVDCASDQHDHLPGDSNYACQRALDRLVAGVRQRYPDIFINLCRPNMDLGVWSLRNADICFTLLEDSTPPSNIAAGDEIRKWSRVRVQHHFFPHYFDQPLLFPNRPGMAGQPSTWPGGHINYIMLSALSSSPNQLYYLPTKTGIPEADKAELRKWLDWGRKNIAYLKVRKDLPDWPAPGKVDGSAHIVGDRGLVFLFNPDKTALSGEFVLTAESIGLKGEGALSITQEHPAPGRTQTARVGETVRWEVPAQTAVVLRIQKAPNE